jgi:glycosyltransferase involved in cell wall biosynthesis
MMISVVIASRNRAPLLASTLAALERQDWPGCPFEIVVVDNASTDDTAHVIDEAVSRRRVPVMGLREDRPGKSHALNTAMAHARGDILVLTDDDVLPSRGWLATYRQAMDETGADYAAGRILPLWEAPPPRWLSPALYGVLAIPDGGTRRLSLAAGPERSDHADRREHGRQATRHRPCRRVEPATRQARGHTAHG